MGKMPENLNINFNWEYSDKRKQDLRVLMKKGDRISVSGGTARRSCTDYVITYVYAGSFEATRSSGNCPNCKHPMESHDKKLKCKDCTDEDGHYDCRPAGVYPRSTDTSEQIDEDTTDPEADDIRQEVE